MTASATGPHQRQEALAQLVAGDNARLLAVAADGTPVALPDSVPCQGVRPAPGARRGLHLDTVLPQDRPVLIAAWESVHRRGVGMGRVRMARSAEVVWLLTVVDARPEHGVFLTTMVEVDPASQPAREPARHPASGSAERRPRTGSLVKDTTANIVDVDQRCLLMLGLTRAAVLGRRSLEFLHPEDHERAVAGWVDLFTVAGSQRVRLRHRRGDGTWLWVELESALQPAQDPAHSTVHCLLTDVSDEMAAHEALRRQERLLHRLTESLPLGIAQLTTDRALVHATTRLAEVLGVPDVLRADDILGRVAVEDRRRLDAALSRVLAGGSDEELEVGLHGIVGELTRRGAVTLVALGEAEGFPGALLCISDVTSSARMRDELTARATYTPNRMPQPGRGPRGAGTLAGAGRSGRGVLPRPRRLQDRQRHPWACSR